MQKKKGTVYKVGAAYFLNKLYWACAWLVVKEDGTVELCKEHRADPIVIKRANTKATHTTKRFMTCLTCAMIGTTANTF